MRPIGDHGLTCMDGDDYAAVALQMQSLGLAVDTALDGISDQLDTYVLRPGVTAVSTAVTALSQTAGVYTPINFAGATILYSNFPASATSVTTPRPGWYQYGCCANLAATGAVTVGSVRRLRMTASIVTFTGTTVLSDCEDTAIDNNTGGGEWLACSGGTFYSPGGITVSFTVAATAPNVASVVNALAGARTWCWFIGSGVQIGGL